MKTKLPSRKTSPAVDPKNSALRKKSPADSLRIKTILVPVDFSKAGKPALHYAKALARLTNARLHVVHVMELIYTGQAFAYTPMDSLRRREHVVREIGAIQVGEFAGLKTSFEVHDGLPFQEIVTEAREIRADLIVMATHGYTGLRHVVMGSTAERVTRHAECPVLIVRSLPARSSKRQPSRR